MSKYPTKKQWDLIKEAGSWDPDYFAKLGMPEVAEALERWLWESSAKTVRIMVDEHYSVLVSSLKSYNYRVIDITDVMGKGTSDQKIKLISDNYWILTKNLKDFEKDAKKHNYDILDISSIKFLDNKISRKNSTSRKIWRAFTESGANGKRGTWKLSINDNGDWKLIDLEKKVVVDKGSGDDN